MPHITGEIREYLERLRLGFVATVRPDGTPNVSPRGTIMAWGDGHLVFADIRSPRTTANLESNPAVEISIVDPVLRKGFRFRGTAAILRDGPEFSKILSQYKKNGVKSGITAIIKVELGHTERVTSPLYDLGLSEAQVRERWANFYSGP